MKRNIVYILFAVMVAADLFFSWLFGMRDWKETPHYFAAFMSLTFLLLDYLTPNKLYFVLICLFTSLMFPTCLLETYLHVPERAWGSDATGWLFIIRPLSFISTLVGLPILAHFRKPKTIAA